MTCDDNPYRSPATDDADLPVIRTEDGSSVEAVLISRGWFHRTVRLSGAVEAVVEYNAMRMGYEAVYVNGRIVLRAPNRDWRLWAPLVPHLEFPISDGTSQVRATIDVRGVIWVRAFRMFVGDRLVYSEGAW